MVILETGAAFLGAFLAHSQLVSHVTRRVVMDYGREASEPEPPNVVVNLSMNGSDHRFPSDDLTDHLIVPPPGSILLLDEDMNDGLPVIGFIFDEAGEGGITWVRSAYDTPARLDCPPSVIALVVGLAMIGRRGAQLRLPLPTAHGAVDGVSVYGLAMSKTHEAMLIDN